MSQDHLSVTLSALADPTRRAILARLSAGEASVSELAKPFKMSLPAITKHLKVLERSGLLTKTKQAQWRRCKLKGDPLKEVADWVNPYKKFWTGNFGRLDEYLLALQVAKRGTQKKTDKNGRKK